MYRWCCIKWYDESCPGIIAIMDALACLDETQYRFARTGEECMDWNKRGNMKGPPNITISAEIEIIEI